jgi:formate hydrogenlyase subunit 3/multisubunit Na+/H+ antiporter MnhD subunit
LLHPLLLPIVAALLLGAVAYVSSRWSPLIAKLSALLAAGVAIASGLLLLQLPKSSLTRPWFVLSEKVPIKIGLELASTHLGTIVMLGSAGFALLIAVYSFRAMEGEYWEGKFYAYLTWTLAGACIVALARNLLVLLVGWELVTLMLFLMINQGRRDAASGAAKTYGMLGFADGCLLLAVVLLMTGPTGSAGLSLSPDRMVLGAGPLGAMGYLIYALILVAALAKAGAIPVHSWIPAAAKDAPAPVMAYLPGALDKLLGIYLLAVLVFRFFAPDATVGVVLLVIGCVTLLGAGLMSIIQADLKRALAFDAVSQVGYMTIGIGAGSWLLATRGSGASALAAFAIAGGLFHMLNHAIYKSSLFLMSGAAARASGTGKMAAMGGLGAVMPVTFVCSLICALAAAGVPPLNGFASKWMVFQGTLGMSTGGALVVLVVAVFASAISLALFVKVLYAVFLSPRPAEAPRPVRRGDSLPLVAPMVVLAVACVVFGVRPDLAVRHILIPAMSEVGISAAAAGAPVSTVGAWWAGPATGLILIGILLGLTFVWVWTRGAKIRVVRPFLAGEVPAPDDGRFRIPGTHFYETVSKLPLVGTLLKHGEGGAMDAYHWSGRHGKTFVELLRRQHTGLISLYVAWVVMGVGATLIYLLLSARS